DEDGQDTIGGYRSGRWFLRNSNTAGAPDLAFMFDGDGVPLTSYRGGIPALMVLSGNLEFAPVNTPEATDVIPQATTDTPEATADIPEATVEPEATADTAP
ncbi:MAG: hypothetical protein AAFV98_22570, partial [Chloroflexota bacterium]